MAQTKNKYNARKTQIDGITFDSKIEAAFYRELKIRQRLGEITKFERQVEYKLQDGYKLPESPRKQRAIVYKADFVIYYPDGNFEVVDIKGSKRTITPAFRLKKKLFEKRYGVPLHLVSSNHGRWIELE